MGSLVTATSPSEELDKVLCRINVGDENCVDILKGVLRKALPADKDIVFLCIGSDRLTGDSFGPLLGTALQEAGVENVYGTLESPVHALNLDEVISSLPEDAFVIAVDACLGHAVNVENITILDGALIPGTGVDKSLTPVGNISLSYIVNVGGFLPFLVLQNTQLGRVVKGVKIAARAVTEVIDERKPHSLLAWSPVVLCSNRRLA